MCAFDTENETKIFLSSHALAFSMLFSFWVNHGENQHLRFSLFSLRALLPNEAWLASTLKSYRFYPREISYTSLMYDNKHINQRRKNKINASIKRRLAELKLESIWIKLCSVSLALEFIGCRAYRLKRRGKFSNQGEKIKLLKFTKKYS